MLPVRARATETLVRTQPCIWGTEMQASPLLSRRFPDEDEFRCEHRKDTTINICTRDAYGIETYFKCKPTTPLQRLFNAFISRHAVNAHAVEFVFGTRHLDGLETPQMLDMEDGDTIAVLYHH